MMTSRWACGLLLSICATSTAAHARAAPLACAGEAYVTNSYGGSIAVVDMAAGRLQTTIPVGEGPVNPVLSRDGARLFVANSGARTITEIDTRTHRVVRAIPVDGKPSGLALLPDGKRIAVTFFGEQPKRPAGEAAAADTPPASFGARSRRDGDRVLTLFGNEQEVPGHLRIVTLATGESGPAVAVGGGPERLALTPDGRRAYVVNLHSGTVSVVDLRRLRVLATIPTGYAGPFNVRIPRSGDMVLVNHTLGSQIVAIDPRTHRIAHVFETDAGPNGMAFSPDHRRLYVTNFRARSLQAIDLADRTVSPPVPVKEMPGFLSVSPDGTEGYFVHPMGRSLAIVDLSAMTVSGTIETGRGPSVVTVCGAP